MLKKLILFPLLLMLFLPSCSKTELMPCRDVLLALTESETSLPAGRIYDLSAPEGEDEYLPERLLNSLFGDGEAPSIRSSWLDAALFLPSSNDPRELAVILCDSPDSADDTAHMLLRRLDVLKTASAGEKHSEYLNTASVTVIGNYALLIISSDSESAINAASDMLDP